jgi:AcrR family transcriptional regulator
MAIGVPVDEIALLAGGGIVAGVTKNGPGDGAAATEPVSWRELAVSRSLDSARTRAENRVQRFLDAALELMDAGDTKEFTVQEVVERSGQSLRSFYQYFGGKHELLLALFEESIRATADHLRALVADEDDSFARVRRFVVEYYRLCRPAPKRKAGAKDKAGSKDKVASKQLAPSPVLVDFAQQLLTAHPAEAARAFVPLVALFEEVLDAAAADGAIRGGINTRRIAGVVLQAIMFNAFSATIAGTSVSPDGADAAEELWDLLVSGLGADTSR